MVIYFSIFDLHYSLGFDMPDFKKLFFGSNFWFIELDNDLYNLWVAIYTIFYALVWHFWIFFKVEHGWDFLTFFKLFMLFLAKQMP